ncbi:MAG: hypothetical protein ACRDE5_18975, partial [Ginsengibacter sp.]
CRQNNNLRNEKNYVLIGTDSVDHAIADKIFVNKYDTSMRLIILYSYGNDTISAKTFFKGKLFDGLNEHFYVNGNVLDSGDYKNGIKDGLHKTYYPSGEIKKIELYIEGKLKSVEDFDSSGKKIK